MPAIAWTVTGLSALGVAAVMTFINSGEDGPSEEPSALSSMLAETTPAAPSDSTELDAVAQGDDDFYVPEPTEPPSPDPMEDAEAEIEDIITDEDIADGALMLAIADAPGESATWAENKVRSQAELVCDLRNVTPEQNLDLALMMLVDSGAEGLELEDQSYFYGVAWVWCEATSR